MCLYPTLQRNRKYIANKKNGGLVPPVHDTRVLYVPTKCGNCIECLKAKAREWQVRLLEDIKHNTNAKFVTLTFSNESIKELIEQKPTKNWPSLQGLTGYYLDNEIATRAVRLFCERWRKKFKQSIRHILITELGHEGTENIHLHGLLWTSQTFETIRDRWYYGHIWPPKEQQDKNYVSERTINYITKYITKRDLDHKEYKPLILTSPGIGKDYVKTKAASKNKFNESETIETYRTNNGYKISMPIYWRNKIYTDEEREALWLHKLDKQERWVCGEKTDISQSETNYYKLLQWHRRINAELGYGTGIKNWNRLEYEEARRKIMIETRLKQAEK